MNPSPPTNITIKDGRSTTIAQDVPIIISPGATGDTFELDSATAQELSMGVIYIAYFADGSQPRAFTRQEAEQCKFYPRLVGRRVQEFDLGGLTLKVTKSQVILGAIASNAGLMDPVMLTGLQGVSYANAVVCEEGTRVQFEVTGSFSGLTAGLRWEIGTKDVVISTKHAAPLSGMPGDSLLVVIDRYTSTNQPIQVESLSTARLTSAVAGTQVPMTVTLKFFRLSGLQVVHVIDGAPPVGASAWTANFIQLNGKAATDAKPGGLAPAPERADSIVVGSLSNVKGEDTPFASAALTFFVTPSNAIAEALFGTF